MFEGKDRQALQTHIYNWAIMLEDMKKPRATLDAIMTTIKSGDAKDHGSPACCMLP